MSLIANLSGTLDNVTHKENLFIENFKLNNENIDLSFEALKFDTNKNNTAYINNVILNTQETETIKIPSLKLLITQDSIKLPDVNIFMPNSKITAKAEVLNYNNIDNLTFASSANGFINSRDLKRFATNSTRYPVKIGLNGNKSLQNLNAQVVLEKTDILEEPCIINLASKLEKKLLKIEDLSLIPFSGNFTDDTKSLQKGAKKLKKVVDFCLAF